jgi:hypothetical protein
MLGTAAFVILDTAPCAQPRVMRQEKGDSASRKT